MSGDGRRKDNLTVAELFGGLSLSLHGPLPWGTQIPESNSGVYLVARGANPSGPCKPHDLQFIDAPGLDLDLEYEHMRWLPNETIVYIGKTDETIRKRVGAFYRHKCGDKSPHAGGQILKLLQCDLWVYWSPAANPYDIEQRMICAFREETGQAPFANADGRKGRIQRSGATTTRVVVPWRSAACS